MVPSPLLSSGIRYCCQIDNQHGYGLPPQPSVAPLNFDSVLHQGDCVARRHWHIFTTASADSACSATQADIGVMPSSAGILSPQLYSATFSPLCSSLAASAGRGSRNTATFAGTTGQIAIVAQRISCRQIRHQYQTAASSNALLSHACSITLLTSPRTFSSSSQTIVASSARPSDLHTTRRKDIFSRPRPCGCRDFICGRA